MDRDEERQLTASRAAAEGRLSRRATRRGWGAGCRAAARLPAWLILAAGLLWFSAGARAKVRFDVFFGYDGIVPEASWFPVACEVVNDGPPFHAVVEVAPDVYGSGQRHWMAVELPTGTLKRFVIPVFSSTRRVYSWRARLLDERGKLRSEANFRPRQQGHWLIPLMGALTRSMPSLPALKDAPRDNELRVARLQAAIFPDHPMALDGLSCLYVSSAELVGNKLGVNQVNALLSWLLQGGHLVLGVDQVSHLNSTPWLRDIVPCQFEDMTLLQPHRQLQDWLSSSQRFDGRSYDFSQPRLRVQNYSGAWRNPYAALQPDTSFEAAPLEVAHGRLRDAQVLVGPPETPQVMTARRGRGRITVLAFCPEREPFRSWTNREYFWAKLADIPPELFLTSNIDRYSGYSLDGVFGAIVDSQQIRKLPVGWLLVLLVAYLVVIGPLDRFWLRKIGKPMLTWITFPLYVAFFSGLIYLIGYKLRAGETEWNELHLIDILPLPGGEVAELSGHTYASVYSPVNARYPVASDQPFATFRSEFLGRSHSGSDPGRTEIEQRANNFVARVTVPVWTSQLYVSDWLRRDEPPLTLALSQTPSGPVVDVDNRLEQALSEVRLVLRGSVYQLGELPPRSRRSFPLENASQGLGQFVQEQAQRFPEVVNYRQAAFGRADRPRLRSVPASAMAASFLRGGWQQSWQFIAPSGLDLSPLEQQGDAIVLAWVADYSPVQPLNRFDPRRQHRDTLFRLAIPAPSL